MPARVTNPRVVLRDETLDGVIARLEVIGMNAVVCSPVVDPDRRDIRRSDALDEAGWQFAVVVQDQPICGDLAQDLRVELGVVEPGDEQMVIVAGSSPEETIEEPGGEQATDTNAGEHEGKIADLAATHGATAPVGPIVQCAGYLLDVPTGGVGDGDVGTPVEHQADRGAGDTGGAGDIFTSNHLVDTSTGY
jgi:hypothetical protein